MAGFIGLSLLFFGLAVLLLGRVLAHLMHSRLGIRSDQCQRRTDTRTQPVFRLSYPQPVIFDFSRRDRHTFEVIIPASSRWGPIPTFHLREASCIKILTYSGLCSVVAENILGGGGTTVGPPGTLFSQPVHQYLIWRNYGQRTPASVLVTADVQLYRTLCSVAQDTERYFHLCSTPAWIRLVYKVLGWIPYYGKLAQEGLVRAALYVQVRAVFYKNDCWPYQGKIWIDWYWWTTPRWVLYFQAWTLVLISRGTLAVLYWIGRLVLGMRESYEEYTLVGLRDAEKPLVAKSEKTVDWKPVDGKTVNENIAGEGQ